MAVSKGRKPLWPVIAGELREKIRSGSLPEPLTIAGLAKRWNVSTRTMWKAVRVLIDEGLLSCTRGSRIRVGGRSDLLPTDASENKFYGRLRERITDGTYLAGQPLPKVDFFTISERISPNTVAAACTRLAREELVHKLGKQWIVGKPRSFPYPPSGAPKRPVVLLLFPFSREWGPFYGDSFLAPFSGVFTTEMQHRGIMLTLAYINRETRATALDELPILSGYDEIAAYVKSQGESYLGALFYAGMGPEPSAAPCIDRLLGLGKPIVYFDHDDRHARWAAQFSTSRTRRFIRLHQDESSACRLVLEALAGAGHTRIGMPWYSHDKARWVPQRVERLKEAAGLVSPQPTLVDIEQTEPFWQYCDQEFNINVYARHIVDSLRPEPSRKDRRVYSKSSLRALLSANTPSLTTLLSSGGVTALAALDDPMAREFYLWARYLGIDIPSDLSLASFDNGPEFRHFPVSTVDPGFARLGYLAAHVLIGDIPVHADRRGNIAARPMLIDRGSVRRPGDVRRLGRVIRK